MPRIALRMLVAAVLVAGLPVVPANAEDHEKGIEIDAQFAGSITGSTMLGDFIDILPLTTTTPDPGYSVTGHCDFAGLLTPNNRLTVTYGGWVTAAGPQVPELTYVKCEISNGLAQAAFSELAQSGPFAETAAVAGPWFVSPITVCVGGFAIYGPTPVVIKTLHKTCDSIIA